MSSYYLDTKLFIIQTSLYSHFRDLLSTFLTLPAVPLGSNFELLLFSTFIKNLCEKINFSDFLFFVGDLQIFPVINSAKDCKLLKRYIDSVKIWSTKNYIIFNIIKTIYFLLLVKVTVFNLACYPKVGL
jgi:hypothetical protein